MVAKGARRSWCCCWCCCSTVTPLSGSKFELSRKLADDEDDDDDEDEEEDDDEEDEEEEEEDALEDLIPCMGETS